MVTQRLGRGQPCGRQLRNAVFSLETILQPRGLPQRLHRHQIAAHPAMLFEVVGHAADSIHRVPQVDMSVTVKIDRILLIGGRHKLTVAHRPGERAFQIQRVVAFAARH